MAALDSPGPSREVFRRESHLETLVVVPDQHRDQGLPSGPTGQALDSKWPAQRSVGGAVASRAS